ncbi:uncharacterized protein J3R85_009781 [Psidium guajava]|nr:uncharacterized protein J3R85_009781 [Psidium guajava]
MRHVWDQIQRAGHCRGGPGGVGLVGGLAPHLEHLLVRVGVQRRDESRARRGPVLGEQPARLVPDAARVAEGLRPQRAGPPLRGLGYLAVQALANRLLRRGQAPIGLGGRRRRHGELDLLFLLGLGTVGLPLRDLDDQRVIRLFAVPGAGLVLRNVGGLLGSELDRGPGIERRRPGPLAASPAAPGRVDGLGAGRRRGLVLGRAGAAAALEDRDRARGLELLGQVLAAAAAAAALGDLVFAHREVPALGAMLHEDGEPFQLNDILVLRKQILEKMNNSSTQTTMEANLEK